MKEKTEQQIRARMREISESRRFHHVRRGKVENRENCYESSMVINPGRKVTGRYRTARQLMDEYEAEEWDLLESRSRMFEAGKGSRFTKRVHVNKGAHYTKSGGVTTTNRVTADGEIYSSVPKAIVTKRFSNSRLTCVCKSRLY